MGKKRRPPIGEAEIHLGESKGKATPASSRKPKRPMPPAVMFSRHEYGATDSWSWELILSRKPGNRWSLLLHQVLWEGGDESEGAVYHLPEFSSGDEFFAFVRASWFDANGEGLDPEGWAEIVENLGPIDATLAKQVDDSVARATDDPADPVSSEESPALQLCVESATWQRTEFGGGGAMWAAIAQEVKSRKAIECFARRHMAEHGQLPRGVHQVRVVFDANMQVALSESEEGAGGLFTFDKSVNFP